MSGEQASPFDFDPANQDEWPPEMIEVYEGVANITLAMLNQLGKQMFHLSFSEPHADITMIFATRARGEELMAAWRSVHAIHNLPVAAPSRVSARDEADSE